MVGRRGVDHRAHERRRAGVGMIDDQPVDELADRLDQGLVLAVLDDQPPRRRAALAGAHIGGLDRDRGGGVDVARIPDDERIVAAHFEREDLVRRLGELAVKGEAGAGRAGEQEAVEPGMGGERLAGLRPALDAAYRAFGHAGLMVERDQIFADRRRLLARLEDDRVAGEQSRDDMAVGQMGREIIGAEHAEHAVRLVADGDSRAHRAFEPALGGAVGIGGDRDVDLVDHRLDLGARFPERLAGLPRDQVGEGLGLAAHRVGEAPQRLDAEGEGARRPGRPGGARGGDLGIDVAGRARPQGRAGGGFFGGQRGGHARPTCPGGGIFQAFA